MEDTKIIYEDKDLLVVDKPAGVLTHPTLANEKNALTVWFKEKHPEVIGLNWPDMTRPGVVHRLDKDTSGLILMAKDPQTLEKLQNLFQSRDVKKTYTALVLGRLEANGKIEASITRGEAGLQKVLDTTYSFSKEKIRPAVTEYRIVKHLRYRDDNLTLIEVMPKTGRMHQIRVHLKHIGYPIIGDSLYNNKLSRKISKELNLNRQFLHSSKVEFINPVINKKMQFDSPLPEDLKDIIVKLHE